LNIRLLLVGVGVVVTSLFATSCASTKPLYPGDRRPRAEVGELRMATNGAITNVNGLELEGHAYELLPGKYSIQFRAYLPEGLVRPGAKGKRRRLTCESAFTVEAGHEYRIADDGVNQLTGMRPPATAGGTGRYLEYPLFVVDFGPDGKPIHSRRAECTTH